MDYYVVDDIDREREPDTTPAKRRAGFRFLLAASMAALALLLAAVSGVVMISVSEEELEILADRNRRSIAVNAAHAINTAIGRVESALAVEAVCALFRPDHKMELSVPFLAEALCDGGMPQDLYFMDTSGRVTSGIGADYGDGEDGPRRRSYLAALMKDGPALTGPFAGAAGGPPVITISVAIKEEDGLIGVLAADISVRALMETARQSLPPDSYMFLVTPAGGVIEHPDTAAFGAGAQGSVTYSDSSLPAYGLLGPMLEGVVPYTVLPDWDGRERTFYGAGIADREWSVVIAVGEEQAEASAQRLRGTFYRVGAVSVILAVLGAYLAATLISYRMAAIIASAAENNREG